MKKRYLTTIIAGTIIMLAGIILTMLRISTEKIAESGIITMGMVMIVIGTVGMLRKHEGVAKDELTRKIADRAAAYSWVITLLTLLIIFWLDHFDAIVFSIKGVIAITYVVMIGTMLLFQRIFWKRGDVA